MRFEDLPRALRALQLRDRQANPLTFRLTSDAAECKIYEIAGQTVNYSFRSITRNITRRLFSPVSR